MKRYAITYSQGEKEFSTNIVASGYVLAVTMVHAIAAKNGYEIKSVQEF